MVRKISIDELRERIERRRNEKLEREITMLEIQRKEANALFDRHLDEFWSKKKRRRY